MHAGCGKRWFSAPFEIRAPALQGLHSGPKTEPLSPEALLSSNLNLSSLQTGLVSRLAKPHKPIRATGPNDVCSLGRWGFGSHVRFRGLGFRVKTVSQVIVSFTVFDYVVRTPYSSCILFFGSTPIVKQISVAALLL